MAAVLIHAPALMRQWLVVLAAEAAVVLRTLPKPVVREFQDAIGLGQRVHQLEAEAPPALGLPKAHARASPDVIGILPDITDAHRLLRAVALPAALILREQPAKLIRVAIG